MFIYFFFILILASYTLKICLVNYANHIYDVIILVFNAVTPL